MSPLARPRDRGSRVYGEKHVEKARYTYLIKAVQYSYSKGFILVEIESIFHTVFAHVCHYARIQYRSMGGQSKMRHARLTRLSYAGRSLEGESIMS